VPVVAATPADGDGHQQAPRRGDGDGAEKQKNGYETP